MNENILLLIIWYYAAEGRDLYVLYVLARGHQPRFYSKVSAY